MISAAKRIPNAVSWMVCNRVMKMLMVSLIATSCASVPKESIELSATVGRDIAEVHKSHRELAVVLFSRMKDDVNRFIDDVYAPYQIQKILEAEQNDFKAGSETSVFFYLQTATNKPDSLAAQNDALVAMNIIAQVVHAEVEAYRAIRLSPVLAQEKEVLAAIERSYNKIHYANSIVTGHLASIHKVHNAQESILNEIGIKGLSEKISTHLARTSDRVADFTKKAKKIDAAAEDGEAQLHALTAQLDKLIRGNTGTDESDE